MSTAMEPVTASVTPATSPAWPRMSRTRLRVASSIGPLRGTTCIIAVVPSALTPTGVTEETSESPVSTAVTGAIWSLTVVPSTSTISEPWLPAPNFSAIRVYAARCVLSGSSPPGVLSAVRSENVGRESASRAATATTAIGSGALTTM